MDVRPAPIGIRIAKRRQILGMTQEELAERVGATRSTVGNWETGTHFPKRYLGKVEDVLGIRLDAPEAEPDIPPEIMRLVEALTPRQRQRMRAWLADLIRREREDGDGLPREEDP